MNFEFESTFEYPKPNKSGIVRTFLLRLIRFDHSVWIVTLNITGFLITGWLYLENSLIPAVYGSRLHGEDWINFLTAAAYVWAITTAHALLRVVFLYAMSCLRQQNIIRLYKNLGMYLRDGTQMLVLQGYMLIHLFLQEPRQTRYQVALALNPRTYINYILTK